MTDIPHSNGFWSSKDIHVLDPDIRACEPLCLLFRLEGYSSAFSSNVGELEKFLTHRQPDVFLVNSAFDPQHEFSVFGKLRRANANAAIFATLNSESVAQTVNAIRAGALDVFAKPLDTQGILRSVAIALSRVANTPQCEVREFDTLTPRENAVLQHIAKGQSNKKTAQKLGISPRTVEVHRARVMQKLGARNLAALMRIVLG